MSNSRAYTEPKTIAFIYYLGVDCPNSINDQVQGVSYSKYSLFLPVVGIEPATSRWFHSEALFNQTLLSTASYVQHVWVIFYKINSIF